MKKRAHFTLVAVSLLVALFSVSSWADLFNDAYDHVFEEAAEIHLPLDMNWMWLKAQCYQESRLDPNAISYVGASGLCQFMPGTWQESVSKGILPPKANIFDPELNIIAAAAYDARIMSMWRAERPWLDRIFLTFASYNAGAGHIIKAQRICGGKNRYKEIIACLPNVTGKHAKETKTYVERIYSYYGRLVFS